MHARASSPARVGILGGMGPAATADFYAKLVEATPARRDQDHVPVVMEADPGIPDRASSFLHAGPSPLPWLQRGAKALEVRGADLLVMPCNTAHLWYDDIARQLSVPMLHIVDAVADEIAARLQPEPGTRLRIGLLATSATLAGRLYPRRAAALPAAVHWRWVEPSAEGQALVDGGIAAVKAGRLGDGRAAMEQALDLLAADGLDAVVHACTEVPLALGPQPRRGVPAVDSNAALARLAVRQARLRLGPPAAAVPPPLP